MLKDDRPVNFYSSEKGNDLPAIEPETLSSGLWDASPGYEFNPKIDIPAMHSWFRDTAHCTPPVTPLFGWHWAKFCSHGLKAACAELSIPACKGWEIRLLNGGIYCSLQIVRDPGEVAEREVKFNLALQPWLDDFDGLWSGYKQELLGIYDKLKKLDVDKVTNLELAHHNYDLMRAYMRMWEIHFLGLYAAFSAWYIFDNITKERFGLKDLEPGFQDMVRGFDNKIYQMDQKMWEFNRLAVAMGITDLFKENEPDVIIAKLPQSVIGQKWYREFISYLQNDDVGGWRMTRFSDLTEPYWLEKPAIPVALVKDNIMRGSDFNLINIRKQLAEKRETAISHFLNQIPPEERDYLGKLLKLSGKVSSYNEEHDLYCELMSQALMRRGYLAIGRRLTQAGTISAPEDIFMLNPEEIDRVIMVPETHDLRWLTGIRRSNWEESCRNNNFPLIFTDRENLDEAIRMDILPSRDAIAIKAIVGESPRPKRELAADLWGVCGCAGEAEGEACVVSTYEELSKVKPGNILVCPGINPAWTPVFGKIKGVITDNGGILCHAAIVGREYGLPTIVNTQKGTSRIKTGQMIRMDATGAIYILRRYRI